MEDKLKTPEDFATIEEFFAYVESIYKEPDNNKENQDCNKEAEEIWLDIEREVNEQKKLDTVTESENVTGFDRVWNRVQTIIKTP